VAQVDDQIGQAHSLDELHRVVRDLVRQIDGIDGHDVRVLETGGGLGFDLEALPRPRVEGCSGRENLERDPSSERFLDRLKDNPHPSSTQLPE
jgi:diaminopimelate decarboxylase